MSKKHNILIIGAGNIGSRRAHTVQKLFPSSKLYIFDTDFKKTKQLAKEVNGFALSSLNKGLKDKSIDIAVIAVINKYSKNLSIKALNNKKHVLCEKPMGMNYKEAKEIYKAVKKNKKKFKCGFNHRYHGGILEAHKLCKKGKIGNLLFIRAAYGHGGRVGYDKEWRSKKSFCGGGQLLDQGSHLIDLCQWLFNFEKLKQARAIKKTMFWKMGVEDNAFILLETKTGKVAQIHASWTQWKNLFRFEIYGTKGSIEVNGLGRSYGIETLSISTRKKLGIAPVIKKRQYKVEKSWELEWLDFIRAINGNKKMMSNEKESLEVMKTINILYTK
ncbi:MAG: Gfo/Idh/MocA family oxidoreductase [Candidatus Melainabacteria bacterium]|nr:Gfo/Idh/MocA family oxidoreductase [Candidatus Melainabacteria bacterium]